MGHAAPCHVWKLRVRWLTASRSNEIVTLIPVITCRPWMLTEFKSTSSLCKIHPLDRDMYKSPLGQQYYGLVDCHASKQIMCLLVRVVFSFASMTSSGFVGLVLADNLPRRSEER